MGYGVHTSREIAPDTWFRPLAIGLCDGVPALSDGDRSVRLSAAFANVSRREEERRSQVPV
ncbi:MAG: hypothetical protein V7K53_12345 [Nostoc sp.]|uniref:hypothetical protein n=1 Tax=Nostoc sp. TaxID=1180 RepID=UPI002FF79A93